MGGGGGMDLVGSINVETLQFPRHVLHGIYLVDEMVKSQGSRESSSSARKKEKPRKLFHESASKSASVTNQSDPGTFDFLFIKRNFACITSSFSRPTCHGLPIIAQAIM
jgi:hypothetical protein